MRLLDTHRGQFVEKDPKETRYAILSHTWDKVEQTYQAVKEFQGSYSDRGRLRVSALPAGLTRWTVHNLGRWHLTRSHGHGSHSSSSSMTSLSASTSPSGVDCPDPLNDSTRRDPVTSIWCDPRLSPKVREACRIAREAGYEYLWIKFEQVRYAALT